MALLLSASFYAPPQFANIFKSLNQEEKSLEYEEELALIQEQVKLLEHFAVQTEKITLSKFAKRFYSLNNKLTSSQTIVIESF